MSLILFSRGAGGRWATPKVYQPPWDQVTTPPSPLDNTSHPPPPGIRSQHLPLGPGHKPPSLLGPGHNTPPPFLGPGDNTSLPLQASPPPGLCTGGRYASYWNAFLFTNVCYSGRQEVGRCHTNDSLYRSDKGRKEGALKPKADIIRKQRCQ